MVDTITTGNIEISAMPAVSSLTGNELFPVVQGGVNKRASLNQIGAAALAVTGATGTFVATGQTITVTNGIITSIV